jgi:hypothetical protein
MARVRVPRSAVITFSPGGVSLATGDDDASLMVFGVTLSLTPGTAVVYDAVTRDLSLPLTPDLPAFTPVASGSAAASPEGAASLIEAAWAIPVAFTTAGNLGQASGPGALRLRLGAGLSARIPSLDLDVPLRGLTVSAGSGLLELIGELDARVEPTIRLWDERVVGTGQPRNSSVLFHA